MSNPSRRSRASCSETLMCLHRLIAGLALQDPLISKAVLDADGDMGAAARLYGLRPDAFRQRHASLLRRIIRSMPAIAGIIKMGRARPDKVSYDQSDKLAISAGIDG